MEASCFKTKLVASTAWESMMANSCGMADSRDSRWVFWMRIAICFMGFSVFSGFFMGSNGFAEDESRLMTESFLGISLEAYPSYGNSKGEYTLIY